MSFRVVRQSKFRHVFGKEEKKDAGFDGVKISRNAWDSPFCSVNTKFISVVLEAQGGGAFMVIPLEKTGRVDLNYPKVTGHTSAVLDVQFCPFNDHIIASGSEDCLVKVWEIPEGGLTSNLDESLVDLEGHQRRVGIVNWHPTAENVLLSAGFDYVIFIWDIETASPIQTLEMHTDTIFSVSWNFDGSLIGTTSKDKMLRCIDARSGAIVSEGKSHEGSKASRVVFCGESNTMFTTGFSRMSERQYAIWDHTNLGKARKLEMIDTGSGVLFAFYDEDTRMVYLAGKGDGNIRYFEVEDASPWCHYLSEYKSSAPQRGICFMPKFSLNINACEIMKCYKLHPKGFIEAISFTVPRKSTLFQEDIFPPTREAAPTMTAAEWAGGANNPPKFVSLKDGFVAAKRSTKGSVGGGAAVAPAKPAVVSAPKPTPAPVTAAKPAVKVNPYAAKKAAAAAASSPSAPADSGVPVGEAALTEAYHAHVAEIAALKAKVAELEIQLASQ